MENAIIYAVCLVGCALQFALGIGVTLLARKRLPRGAYFLGFLIPVLIPIALWFLYIAIARRDPCPPDVIGCGEAAAYALFLLLGVFIFNLVVSAVIQFVMWLAARRNKPAEIHGTGS